MNLSLDAILSLGRGDNHTVRNSGEGWNLVSYPTRILHVPSGSLRVSPGWKKVSQSWTWVTAVISAAWASSGAFLGYLDLALSSASPNILAALSITSLSSVSMRTHWGLEHDCCSFLHTLLATSSMVDSVMQSGSMYAKLILCPHTTNGIPRGAISLMDATASSPPQTLMQSALSRRNDMVSLSEDENLKR